MVALIPTLSSTCSRLNLLPKTTIFYSSSWAPKPHFIIRKLPNCLFSNSTPTTFSTSISSPTTHYRVSAIRDDLVVLGIETSCDDTAAAVVRSDGEILSQVVSSQADLVAKYGGVAPKMAEEAHSQVIDEVVQRALDEAKLTETDLSAVAVTIGPGLSLCLRGNLATKTITVLPSSCRNIRFLLVSCLSFACYNLPCLSKTIFAFLLIRICSKKFVLVTLRKCCLVGVQKARKIAGRFCLPIVGIHHMEAHALVARLVDKNLQFPFLALLVSGGHNLLILASDLGHYVQLGTTIDDAIGEAYDKIARWLGLDMRRAGPALEELAREGNDESIKFRVPMKQHKDCNFSYAGLKTQVRLAIESKNIDPDVPISSASCQDRTIRADIAASFQRVAVMHLEERCERAIEWALQIEPSIKSLVVSGGVASNQYLRIRLNQIVEQNGLRLVCPPPRLCIDNGVMIAWTGIEHFTRGRYDPPPPADEPDDALLDLRPRWPLGEEHVEGRSHARSLRKARMHPSLTSMIQGSTQSH